MTVTISRLYDDYDHARAVMSDLRDAGVPDDDVSIVANNADGWYDDDDRDRDGVDDRAEGAGRGAGVGAALGGAAGLLAGLGLLAIPGLGPVVAAGWLASTAAAAAVGGAAGGMIGALTRAGVDEEEAHVYAEGVRRGGTLVAARVPEVERERIAAVMDRTAVSAADRAGAFREGGWSRFDEGASPLTAEEVRRQREFYRGGR